MAKNSGSRYYLNKIKDIKTKKKIKNISEKASKKRSYSISNSYNIDSDSDSSLSGDIEL